MCFGIVIAVVFVGLFEDFRQALYDLLRKEVVEAQDGAGVGVVLPLPSGPASGPWNTLNEHFWL